MTVLRGKEDKHVKVKGATVKQVGKYRQIGRNQKKSTEFMHQPPLGMI